MERHAQLLPVGDAGGAVDASGERLEGSALSERLAQQAKTSKEIAIYLHDAMGFIAPCFVKKEEIPQRIAELENEKWVRLVDAQQQITELQNEISDGFNKFIDKQCHVKRLEGRLQRIREHISKAPIPSQYISKEKDFDNFLRYVTDARQWFETLKKLAVVGEGDTP